MIGWWRVNKSKIIWCFVVLVGLFGLARLYYALTDDFRFNNITYEIPYQKNWAISSTSSQEEAALKQILSQPYSYLGKGAQSYAFSSEDGHYVLKFFKFKHLRPAWMLDWLPSFKFIQAYRDNLSARKSRKLYGVFRSYKLAYDFDREESGLLFIQLNVVDNPQRSVNLIDKIGIHRVLDLSKVAFILQERGETLRVVLDQLLKEDNVSLAEKRISQILELYVQEYQKGIYDHDHGVMRNTGFIGERPFHLDVGKLVKEETMKNKQIAKQDILVVTGKIKQWIQKYYPEKYLLLSKFIDQKIVQLFDKDSNLL